MACARVTEGHKEESQDGGSGMWGILLVQPKP